MPDNTQILFPPSSVEEQRRDFDREAAAADGIARTVSQGSEAGLNLIQRTQRTPPSSWKRPAFDPGKMAENFSADEKCDSCAVCEEICPVRNIVMEGATPRWQNRCEQCLACMQWCPQQAIQFSKRTSEWGRYHHPDVSVTELLRRSCK
jgi:Fe-S-cluster-containing hydrogenase component 2